MYYKTNNNERKTRALQDKDISKSDMPEGYDFSHIPDWYRWERDEVRREIKNGTYKLEVPVKIRIGDTNALYYCFPPEDIDIVAKTRLATEEIYKCLSSAT